MRLPVIFDARGNGDGLTSNCLVGDHLNRVSDYTPLVVDRRPAREAGRAPVNARGYTVRRLTPKECERLQGFPDNYTLVPVAKGTKNQRVAPAADTPRYQAIGNSMAVPVMRWICRRIQRLHRGFTTFRQRSSRHRS
ncbi:MAG: DNA cytosine methyltransferase [Verrucomicrobiota bacterium]